MAKSKIIERYVAFDESGTGNTDAIDIFLAVFSNNPEDTALSWKRSRDRMGKSELKKYFSSDKWDRQSAHVLVPNPHDVFKEKASPLIQVVPHLIVPWLGGKEGHYKLELIFDGGIVTVDPQDLCSRINKETHPNVDIEISQLRFFPKTKRKSLKGLGYNYPKILTVADSAASVLYNQERERIDTGIETNMGYVLR